MSCALLDQPGSYGATQPAQSTHEEVGTIAPKTQPSISCLRWEFRGIVWHAHDQLPYVVSFLHSSDRLRDCAATERLHGANRLDMALLIEFNGATQEADHVVSMTSQSKTKAWAGQVLGKNSRTALRTSYYLPLRHKRPLLAEMRQVKAHERPVRQEPLHRQLPLAHEVAAPDLDKRAALGDAVPRGVQELTG